MELSDGDGEDVAGSYGELLMPSAMFGCASPATAAFGRGGSSRRPSNGEHTAHFDVVLVITKHYSSKPSDISLCSNLPRLA